MTAEMARLLLSESDIPKISDELSAILAYANSLAEVDVINVPSMTHAVPDHCPLRGDVVEPHIAREAALRNAPQRESAYFAVPAVFAESDEGFDSEG